MIVTTCREALTLPVGATVRDADGDPWTVAEFELSGRFGGGTRRIELADSGATLPHGPFTFTGELPAYPVTVRTYGDALALPPETQLLTRDGRHYRRVRGGLTHALSGEYVRLEGSSQRRAGTLPMGPLRVFSPGYVPEPVSIDLGRPVPASPVPGQEWERRTGAGTFYRVHVDALYIVDGAACVAFHVLPSHVATIAGDPRDFRALPVAEFQGLYTLPA